MLMIIYNKYIDKGMDLIDYQLVQVTIVNKGIGQQYFDKIIDNSINQNIIFETLLTKISDEVVASKFDINGKQECTLLLSYFNFALIKCRNTNTKNTLLRYFLKINRQNGLLIFVTHPCSGQFCLRYFASTRAIGNLDTTIDSLLATASQQIKALSSKYYQQIMSIVQNNSPIGDRTDKHASVDLKKMIKISPKYAWNMLRTCTKSKKLNIKSLYEEARKQFIESMTPNKQNYTIRRLSSLFKDSNPIGDFQMFNLEQEKELKLTYLAKLNNNPKINLINQITLSDQNMKKLFRERITRIQCHEKGKIPVLMEVYPKQKKYSIAYEYDILSKLPNQQYLGLPRYYKIKNFLKQTDNCIITNLTTGQMYTEFMESNAQTISIFTKLYIIHQMTLILKYLHNHRVVYHGLRPQHVFIKKGLTVKATGFFNSFHKDANLMALCELHFPWRSILPHISNIEANSNLSYGDEKADVFSLGMMIYETIFKKPLLQVKRKTTMEIWNQKLLKPFLVSPEKNLQQGDLFLQILLFLSFECTHHQRISKSENMETINIEQRPHLDWVVIIIKYITQVYRKRYG